MRIAVILLIMFSTIYIGISIIPPKMERCEIPTKVGGFVVYRVHRELSSKPLRAHNVRFKVRGVSIVDVWIDPQYPEYDDHVIIYASVNNADEVKLNYTYGTTYSVAEMNRQEGSNIYYYILPPNSYGTSVTFRIQAYNYTSSEAVYSDWYSFTYDDHTPPEIHSISTPNNSIAKSTLTFALNVTEPENASGIYGAWLFLQYSHDNESWSDYEVYALSLNHTTGLWELKLTFIYHGYYRYYFRVDDNAGNIAYEPKEDYFYLKIYPRYAEILCDNITIRYSDTQTITIRLMDLNSSTPLPQAYIDVYLNTTSGMIYLTTVQTNTTGYARFMLTADRSVGEYQLIFVFQDPSYRTLTKRVGFTIILELIDFDIDYDTNTYDAELTITVTDDEGDLVDYGYLRISSGPTTLFYEHITTATITLTVNVWNAISIIENDTWWLYLNISFWNENYENTTHGIRIPIYATRIDASYNATVVQGQMLVMNISIYDPDTILNYTILVDGEEIERKTAIQKGLNIVLEHQVHIGAGLGNHTIEVLVTDTKLSTVSRKFAFVVVENRIMLDYDMETGFRVIRIGGSTYYEYAYPPENITIKVIVGGKIYEVRNRFVSDNIMKWDIEINNVEGDVIVKIVASDPYGHSAISTKTIHVRGVSDPVIVAPISVLAGVILYVVIKKKKERLGRKIVEKPL